MPKSNNFLLTIILLLAVTVLFFLNAEKVKPFELNPPNNIVYDELTNTISLDSLTLKQKIAQMTVAYGRDENKELLQNMLVGSVYLAAEPSKNDFIQKISSFQDNAFIPFLVAVDLEGCINPFANFQSFPSLKDIEDDGDAFLLGQQHARLLNELSININFAPVVDLRDTIWNCRSFSGTPEQVSAKAVAYVNALQSNNIIATSKHYPGKTLNIEDPHKQAVYAFIDESDLLPFEQTINNKVSAVMISHVVASGLVNSEAKPSATSILLTSNLRNQFSGLIITDDIAMSGLRDFYTSEEQMYVDLFKADNDLVLNFDSSPKNIYNMISVVEDAVNQGLISEERIDRSVIKILNAKGINVE